MKNPIAQAFAEDQKRVTATVSRELLGSLIQPAQYVGEVFSMGYETALVQIHDYYRQQVGGVPSLSFLIATRLLPDEEIDPAAEDSAVLLLRVMDAAPLPNEAEALRVRVETAQRVSGEAHHWDDQATMDPHTAHLLSFAGVKCRIIGTFYLDPAGAGAEPLVLRFGSDISNFYPNKGLKVYKPTGEALRRIVNYRDPSRTASAEEVTVGNIRYASTNRAFQGVADVPVSLAPEDLLSQRTALFGMTRTGKSNTTKIMIQSVFELRFKPTAPLRVGQLVFDPNGEYANENVQDAGAIKNVWNTHERGDRADVITYGVLPHPLDPNRRLMLLNFLADDNLQIGKEIIDASLAEDTTKYIQNFRQVSLEVPDPQDRSATVRHTRRVLVYRALLAQAGFAVPQGMRPQFQNLFNADLVQAMATSQSDNAAEYQAAANTLQRPSPTWGQVASALASLNKFINEGTEYGVFNNAYMRRLGGSGDPWADEDLKKLLGVFQYPNGVRLLGRVRDQHTNQRTRDYAEEIYEDLIAGRLVIVDQSSGEPQLNEASAERMMWHVFRQNQDRFRRGEPPPEILIYVEEAHNLLPAGSDADLDTVWVRTAKEGAKYHLGLVYATQEVSSVQKNILRNTGNWFIGHLNNTDETKELTKYYDFADFESSIRRAQDRGFLRVKTLSNMFVTPVQIRLFQAPPAAAPEPNDAL